MTSQHRRLPSGGGLASSEGRRPVAASQMLEGGNSDLVSVADFKSFASSQQLRALFNLHAQLPFELDYFSYKERSLIAQACPPEKEASEHGVRELCRRFYRRHHSCHQV